MKHRDPWPPTNGSKYVRSQVFSTLVLNFAERLAKKCTYMDFAGASAQVVNQYVDRVNREPGFLSEGRFPTFDAFEEHVCQAIWDAAWPPSDGRGFVRSEEFGLPLLEIAEILAERYRQMDFTDGVAQIFTWFESRLKREPDFFNERRFPTITSFKAYLRQALWNAARLAERKRANRQRIEALSAARPITSRDLQLNERDQLLDLVQQLSEPHKTIFTRYFFDEEEPQTIASSYGYTEKDVLRIYIEAVDQIGQRKKS
jgi:hypothetical protein